VRIVLDTNVAVSGLLWHNTPYRLLKRAVEDEAIELFSSPALLAELTEVLERANLAAELAELNTSVEALVALYGTFVQLVMLASIARVAPDPDDDEVIACAIAAGAMLLVTGDRTLLALKTHQSVEIVSPAQALQRLTA
jgi:uncharacterized protein